MSHVRVTIYWINLVFKAVFSCYTGLCFVPCWFTSVVSMTLCAQRQFEDWRKAAKLKEIVTDIDDSAWVTVGRKRPAYSSLKATSLSIALASNCYPKILHRQSLG
jgi:hypothetical protein